MILNKYVNECIGQAKEGRARFSGAMEGNLSDNLFSGSCLCHCFRGRGFLWFSDSESQQNHESRKQRKNKAKNWS